jgi:hypothetical protein
MFSPLHASCRKQLCDKYNNDLYAEVKKGVDGRVNAGGDLIGTLVTDGWRKKAAHQGVPLINVNLLYPEAGSDFINIVTPAGVTKDAEWIAEMHEDIARELTNGDFRKLLGMIMDNTKANRAGMDILHEYGRAFPGRMRTTYNMRSVYSRNSHTDIRLAYVDNTSASFSHSSAH